jgi:branched-chain amino acid aminotransferase
MTVPVFSIQDLSAGMARLRKPYHAGYLAMYSGIWKGIVTDPVLMTVPVDDHLVHRADAVFDVFKCVRGRAYCFTQHMARLEKSAKGIDLKMPADYSRIDEIVRASIRAAGEADVVVRVMISRGPGGFSTNPFECPESILYVVITRLKTPPPEHYERGVAIISAPVPVKPPLFANIKSCDYLGNVLVKKAAKEAGVEYAVNWDENGFLAEGSTENILLVSDDGRLLVPGLERVLKGVTMTRVMELTETLVREGLLKKVDITDIDRNLAARCPEVLLTGTSIDVVPVTTWDGRPVGDGTPGPITRRLIDLIRKDQTENPDVLTEMI